MPAFWTVVLENSQCRARYEAQECQEAAFQEKEKVSVAFESTERKLKLLVERLEMN